MNSIIALEGVWGITAPHAELADFAEIDGEEILAQIGLPILVIGRDLRCLSANPAMAALCGRPLRSLQGSSLAEIFPTAIADARRAFELFNNGTSSLEQMFEWRGKRYQLAATPMRAPNGISAIIITATDVTRRLQAFNRLRRSRRRLLDDARHDHLTGLLNRRGLDARLRKHMGIARRSGQPLSVLIADVDWFKAYNDHFGHLAGDQCLRRIARILRQCVHRAGGAIARYGGEEFVAILPGMDSDSALPVASELRCAVLAAGLEHPASSSGHITVSIGVAAFERGTTPCGAEARQGLLQAADDALYLAKVHGRNQVRVFAATSHS